MNADTEIQSIPKLLTDETSKYKGPGWQLRTAREAAQIGIGDVARQLRLSVDMIAAIERDDYSHMAGLTFIRGYLRSYARLLNLSGDEILIAFDRLGIPEKVPQIPLNIYGNKQTVVNDTTIRSISYVVFAALVIIGAVWWHSQSSNANTPSSVKAPAAVNPTAIAPPAPVPSSNTDNPINNQAITHPLENKNNLTTPVAPSKEILKPSADANVQPKVIEEATETEEVKPKPRYRSKSRRHHAAVDEEVTSTEPSTDGESD